MMETQLEVALPTREELIAEARREIAAAGGRARAESLSARKRKQIASSASKARWAKAKKKAR